jgi:hypothetical protein
MNFFNFRRALKGIAIFIGCTQERELIVFGFPFYFQSRLRG